MFFESNKNLHQAGSSFIRLLRAVARFRGCQAGFRGLVVGRFRGFIVEKKRDGLTGRLFRNLALDGLHGLQQVNRLCYGLLVGLHYRICAGARQNPYSARANA